MRKLLFGMAFVAMAAAPGVVAAQTTAGPFLAFHNDFDFGIGAYVTIPAEEIHENLAFSGSFGYFFPGSVAGADLNYWELNADAILRIPTESESLRPFLLGGLNLARGSSGLGGGSSTEAGLNLGGGVSFPGESFTPIVGAKAQIDGGDGFVFFGALGFPVG